MAILLAVGLTLLGSYFVLLSAWTMLNVGQLTSRWVLLSGDPDFVHDAPRFQMWFTVFAGTVGLIGVATAYGSIRSLVGRPRGGCFWGALTVAITTIQFPWLLYRQIGARDVSLGPFLIRCIAVSVVYVLAWAFLRKR